MKTTKKVRDEAKDLFRLCLIDGSLDEDRVRRVMKQVLASRRRGYLSLATQFQRLVRLETMRYTAQVESASPLSHVLQTEVQASLEKLYGSGINTSFAERPALIGGMRIRVGSDVYDGSVRAALAALEKAF